MAWILFSIIYRTFLITGEIKKSVSEKKKKNEGTVRAADCIEKQLQLPAEVETTLEKYQKVSSIWQTRRRNDRA